uniref:Cyclic nucleotide-binding domain-containing protein n=1 Tax=Chromera velia CCMP2878 TaxID=1169474 RepID=A0A0G4HS32_9ALVE|eukprot:Cvel_30824.t1-p1 / transcript=Cvel_30824.t1 / gene=Cvel_30824 / organism=Chromera_velia_CCMP2878 / gene_product=hypothetical protein / transcript_product=hypothetical protein / location=Cvel_scaffold4474:7664-9214(-) / protein_length=517 / sequence_SO=supercontig / SO=protein_coding / is_pseudo=false
MFRKCVDFFSSLSGLREMPASDLSLLASKGRVKSVEGPELLVRQGQDLHDVLFFVKGSASLLRVINRGKGSGTERGMSVDGLDHRLLTGRPTVIKTGSLSSGSAFWASSLREGTGQITADEREREGEGEKERRPMLRQDLIAEDNVIAQPDSEVIAVSIRALEKNVPPEIKKKIAQRVQISMQPDVLELRLQKERKWDRLKNQLSETWLHKKKNNNNNSMRDIQTLQGDRAKEMNTSRCLSSCASSIDLLPVSSALDRLNWSDGLTHREALLSNWILEVDEEKKRDKEKKRIFHQQLGKDLQVVDRIIQKTSAAETNSLPSQSPPLRLHKHSPHPSKQNKTPGSIHCPSFPPKDSIPSSSSNNKASFSFPPNRQQNIPSGSRTRSCREISNHEQQSSLSPSPSNNPCARCSKRSLPLQLQTPCTHRGFFSSPSVSLSPTASRRDLRERENFVLLPHCEWSRKEKEKASLQDLREKESQWGPVRRALYEACSERAEAQVEAKWRQKENNTDHNSNGLH